MLAVRIDEVTDASRLAHTRGVVLCTSMLRRIPETHRREGDGFEAKLREFIESSRRARDDTRALLDELRTRLLYKQGVVDDVDRLIDQMTASLGLEGDRFNARERIEELFPRGNFGREEADVSLPPCPVCSSNGGNRVVLSCGHSFCHSCVVHSLEFNRDSNFRCFTCRAEVNNMTRLFM